MRDSYDEFVSVSLCDMLSQIGERRDQLTRYTCTNALACLDMCQFVLFFCKVGF